MRANYPMALMQRGEYYQARSNPYQDQRIVSEVKMCSDRTDTSYKLQRVLST